MSMLVSVIPAPAYGVHGPIHPLTFWTFVVVLFFTVLAGAILYSFWTNMIEPPLERWREKTRRRAEIRHALRLEEKRVADLNSLQQAIKFPTPVEFREALSKRYFEQAHSSGFRLPVPYLALLLSIAEEIYAKAFTRPPTEEEHYNKFRNPQHALDLVRNCFLTGFTNATLALRNHITVPFDARHDPSQLITTSIWFSRDGTTLPHSIAALKSLADPFVLAAKELVALGIFHARDLMPHVDCPLTDPTAELKRQVAMCESNSEYATIFAPKLEHLNEQAQKYKAAYIKARQEALENLSPHEAAVLHSPYLHYAHTLLTEVDIPFTMPPLEKRFEHHWLVAPSGSGKTNALATLILQDYERVKNGEATIVVIDSQRELIEGLASTFDPSHTLLLEPDPENPLALNVFDPGKVSNAPPRDRERLLNSSLEMTEFILTGLMGAELTPMMASVYRYVLQAMMVIPHATLLTFREFMGTGAAAKYSQHLNKLDPYVADFLRTQLDATNYNKTKEGVLWRLDSIMSDNTFRRMFATPQNKLDLFEELQSPKAILIHTDLALLKRDRTEVFGRFFIAKIMQAVEQRATLAPSARLPTIVYIDECQDYIANEEKVAELIDKARKQRVGFVFSHQRLANITSSNVLDALSNVSIRMAAHNETDTNTLSKLLRAEPEFITSQPKGSFATYIRGVTQQAIPVKFPKVDLSIDHDRLDLLRQIMHERYSVSPHPPVVTGSNDDQPPIPPIPSSQSEPADQRWQKGW